MTHEENLLSPTTTFHFFIISVWTFLSLERESYWSWSLRTSSIQCHSNPILVPPCNPPDHVKAIYDGQTCDLKTKVDIWTRIDVVPV